MSQIRFAPVHPRKIRLDRIPTWFDTSGSGPVFWNPNYAQQAKPDRYALWQQRIRHRHPVIVQVI
jgi:hypothetical protein